MYVQIAASVARLANCIWIHAYSRKAARGQTKFHRLQCNSQQGCRSLLQSGRWFLVEKNLWNKVD